MLEGRTGAITVVGVSIGARLSSLDEESGGELFLPAAPEGSPVEVILVRTARDFRLDARDIALAATGVVRRMRELGIRSALGASAPRLVRMVVGDYLRAVVAGIAAGLLFSWWAAQALRAFVYQIDVYHPVVWVFAVATLLVACVIAAWAPARRAARADPVLVLRAEG